MGHIKDMYTPFNEWTWKSYDGKRGIDIEDFIAERKGMGDIYFIGTDSQNYSKKRQTCFTTVLIAYRMHHGGCPVIYRDRVPMIESLRQRLLTEAMRSLEVAWFLDARVPKENIIGIHLDVNPSLRFKSGKYKEELVGLVAAQGFRCMIKPDAWAASGVADRKC